MNWSLMLQVFCLIWIENSIYFIEVNKLNFSLLGESANLNIFSQRFHVFQKTLSIFDLAWASFWFDYCFIVFTSPCNNKNISIHYAYYRVTFRLVYTKVCKTPLWPAIRNHWCHHSEVASSIFLRYFKDMNCLLSWTSSKIFWFVIKY